ncbi:hypothetical protein DTO013E5_1308 [Penicillium roqueforti]|uniref:Genomic scaffold, ProqFM164S01 n=1 Tax=Penicillium roqueforti (strain FM164) TaxID=1365484 RepID=W6PXD2_PENRF|nr:uncharacterized protein LCP9604111_2255 [Penicillium roqueforti]CDM28878.1 unnamed protein product [Penicillium roqueforti FM164]KAF9252259.1 hypothetical protein LCP9604111_2255 [Penicillium roqueforti]KAI1837529.1 hypothetical protein CBS147337_1812 [Penicillium roqueforti]KAI2682386.1 hypothetical protein LCP963914a_6274 [Penicillium roqueforti]KAI2690513.1 hypothetical protein CBS147355_964 [Penicillium roqueforti]
MSADEAGDTTPMSTTNSEPHPDPATNATSGKRKRSTQDDKPSTESSAPASRDRTNLHETLRSLIELLLKHDTELQLLSCPFPNSTAKPRTKRAKVSGDSETSNIQTRVNSGKYNTLQEFLSDIERASAAVIERNQTQANGAKEDGAPLNEVVNRIAAFKKHMNSLIGQSFVNQPEVKTETMEDDTDESSELHAINVCQREDKPALTLFGNPSNPRQLFSSLQKSVKVPLSESGPEKFVEVQEELREVALPNGIAATKVIPFNLDAAQASKRTFGEVFAPRETLPKLEPPRKRSHRANSATWTDRFDATFDVRTFLGERSNYCLAPLPSTQWLQYGGVTSSPAYWDRVEKHADSENVHRHGDPALWTGPDSSAFQGVFSSFAPSYDSSGAIVQLASKDMVWWGQRGAARMNTLLSVEADSKQNDTQTAQPGNIGELDESILDEMVESFNAQDFAGDITETDPISEVEPESKEIKQMLQDVSDLLDTLSSYQRLRSLKLSSDLQLPGQQLPESNETPSLDLGDVNTPSEAETLVYDTLKSSLAAVISNLPPYAVAKLDGDQLAELNISQKVLVDIPDYSGTMEKDDFTLSQERAAALLAAASAANRTSTPSASRPSNYQGSHSAYNQRAFASNARAPPQPGFQVTPQHARQPSVPNTYTHAYGAGRPPSTPSQRPVNTPQYAQMNPQYSQGSQAPQYQRPTSNGYAQVSPQPYTPQPRQPGTFNATPQGRTPYATATANQRVQYPGQTPSQAGYSNSAASATYSRSAAEQAALMDRNKAQLAARQSGHSPSTPQPQGSDARASQEGSMTPGSKANGTPLST